MFPYFTRHSSLVYKLCSPGVLRQGCEILEDREGGPGGESVQETVWKSGSSREGGTAFLSVHFKSDDYDIRYNTILLTIHTSFIQNYIQKYNLEESKSIWKGSLKKNWLENITKKCRKKIWHEMGLYRVCRIMLWFCFVCLVPFNFWFAHIIFAWFCYDFASAI